MATSKTPRRSASVNLSLISQKRVAPQDVQEVLTTTFSAHDYIDCIKNLTGWQIDPQAYVDGLDQVCSRLSMLVGILTAIPLASDDKHPGARVRSLLPLSPSTEKDLRYLRDPASFILHATGTDPGNNR